MKKIGYATRDRLEDRSTVKVVLTVEGDLFKRLGELGKVYLGYAGWKRVPWLCDALIAMELCIRRIDVRRRPVAVTAGGLGVVRGTVEVKLDVRTAFQKTQFRPGMARCI